MNRPATSLRMMAVAWCALAIGVAVAVPLGSTSAAGEPSRSLLQADVLPQKPKTPSPEAWRAIWNHSGTGAYPGNWDRSARLLDERGFNVVLPNMLSPTTAHYPSDVLPRSQTFRRHGDQVAGCLKAARRHGLQVHVWMVCYKCLGATRDRLDELERDGRLQVSAQGEVLDWLCPSSPENLRLLVAAVEELLDRYAVDGLHLDYIRYPGRKGCYCDGCRRRFQAQSPQGRVRRWPTDCFNGERSKEYADWRRQRVTGLVERIRNACRRHGAGQGGAVVLSAAVFGYYPDCRNSFAQDWGHWVQRGLLDVVCPMNYTERLDEFTLLVRRQVKTVGRRARLCPGIGAAAAGVSLSAKQVEEQIDAARQLHTDGFTVFDLTPATAERLLPKLQVANEAREDEAR